MLTQVKIVIVFSLNFILLGLIVFLVWATVNKINHQHQKINNTVNNVKVVEAIKVVENSNVKWIEPEKIKN